MTSYLTTNEHGLHTNATLATDIERAIGQSYRVLQATIRAMRDIDVFEGKINGTHAHLLGIANELLAACKADAEVCSVEKADRAADAALEACLPLLSSPARNWDRMCRSQTPGIITMIAYRVSKDSQTNYVCYASDARKLSRAIGQPYRTIKLKSYSIPVFFLAKTEIGMYADQLSRMAIELVII